MIAEVKYLLDGVVQIDRYEAGHITWTIQPDGRATVHLWERLAHGGTPQGELGAASYACAFRIRRGAAVEQPAPSDRSEATG